MPGDNGGVGFSGVVRSRPLALGAAVLLVAALLAAGAGYFLDRATSQSLPTCERFALESQARADAVSGEGRRVVVIGDSYSAGFGLEDLAASWPSQLPGEVHVAGFSGSGFSAGASPCRKVSYAERAPRALAGGAALVVVQGGLNDVGQPPAAVREGVRRLLAVLPEVPVVLVGPPPAPARMPGAAAVDALLAREALRAGVRYVSLIGTAFAYDPGLLHLTPAGHVEFGKVVAASLPAP